MSFCLFMSFLFYPTDLSVSSFTASTLVSVDLAARAQPGDHPPAALSMQTLHTAGLPPTPVSSVPLLTLKVVSSNPPSTTAFPPWALCVLCLGPTLAPPFPLMHPAPVYSSPAPWRVPSCLSSDCGPALLPQWLQTCKLLCHPPSATIPSSMRSEPQHQREGSSSMLVLTPEPVLFQP